MQKRAQVTTFILLGIIIAIVLFIVFYFLGERLLAQTQNKTPFDKSQLIPLQKQIESCIQLSLDKSVINLRRNAFFLEESPYTLEYGGAKISYLIYPEDSPNKLLSIEGVQDEISNQIVSDLVKCSLDKFNNLNIKKNDKEIKAETTIAENKVLIALTYPMEVSRSGTKLQLKDFSYSKETDLGAIYNTINDIISGELQGEFDTVSYFNEKRNVVINKNNLDDKNIIYLVSSPQEKEYVMFAIKR